ncbi:MAG: hypothetical protein IIY00_01360, partial [Clostridia bacterium]|nr:hypothetical protein [Clostridia bacterium]
DVFMKLIKQVFGDNHFVKIFYNVFVAHCTSPSLNSYLSFGSLYHIFLFTSMLGEIAGVRTHQSKSKKGAIQTTVESMRYLLYNIDVTRQLQSLPPRGRCHPSG